MRKIRRSAGYGNEDEGFYLSVTDRQNGRGQPGKFNEDV